MDRAQRLSEPVRPFTAQVTRPGGTSCVLTAGENWNDLRKREEERIAQLDSLADWRGR